MSFRHDSATDGNIYEQLLLAASFEICARIFAAIQQFLDRKIIRSGRDL